MTREEILREMTDIIEEIDSDPELDRGSIRRWMESVLIECGYFESTAGGWFKEEDF